jgi:hypothetical protein
MPVHGSPRKSLEEMTTREMIGSVVVWTLVSLTITACLVWNVFLKRGEVWLVGGFAVVVAARTVLYWIHVNREFAKRRLHSPTDLR